MLTPDFESLGLQVNLTPRERRYFDKLKAELLELFDEQTYDQIKASEDATLLKKISDKLAQLEEFVKKRELPKMEILTATTPEGREIEFDLAQELKYWTDFYREQGVDWVTLPESISVTPEQAEEMIKLMEQGFDKLLIIPENLVDEPEITIDPKTQKPTAITNPHYRRLHELMSQGYNETYTGSNCNDDGKFEGSQDKTRKFRILLTKDVQYLEDDPLFMATIGKSIEDLEQDELVKFTGFSEATYLVYQREYYLRTNKHLDEKGWTWLPESPRPLSGRVTSEGWVPITGRLNFDSYAQDFRCDFLGCRLVSAFEL